ncbi:putative ankyrin repeat-containing domain, PGG domain, ankyrin repeat-containing domain superfamily [Helianthus annuus]|nr:putative ankyrin repeat-containing domain, PGG domain, ankyrin repeat-containing domain superfamily [Helianthus annuus]
MSASSVILYDSNVSNFVSVKLSGNKNYLVWRSQMLCLLDSNNMGGIVEPAFVLPRFSDTETQRQYDSLAKGWILGSVSEDILVDIHDLDSAKAVWEKLKSNYDPVTRSQKGNEVDGDVVLGETNTVEEGANSIDIKVDPDVDPDVDPTETNEINRYIRWDLVGYATYGNWPLAERALKADISLATEAGEVGSTLLHIAVENGHNDFVKKLLPYIKNNDDLLKQRDSDRSTALHIAAKVGSTDVVDLLVKRNKKLLLVKDINGKAPLHRAYESLHLDTIAYILKVINDEDKTELQSSLSSFVDDDMAVELVVNAISAKQYSLALELVQNFPKSASRSDDVLMALAKNFPRGLDDWEELVYPSLDQILELLRETTEVTILLLVFPVLTLWHFAFYSSRNKKAIRTLLFKLVILTVPAMITWPFVFICLLLVVIYFVYFLLWKGAKILFATIKRIENKTMDLDVAREILHHVCYEIARLGNSGNDLYTRPILEAACQNAYEVVHSILFHSRKEDITNKSGYDIIHLAIINRSEKIYNLIYDGTRKNRYRLYKDSYENNILHLAGRLAPSTVLNQRTGAALQLQRELQWREEVKKFVFPTYITQENIFKETPNMVFTMAHKDLVKEGEQWMKTTAESCSITAALIITIVFAAAITVPGGNNQEKGTPLFKKESAFIIFAISDAISLFASSTALLVFLSILTARFAENDFLVSLPRRLFIGLFALLLSTTSMMIAFSATLFLVFCDKKLWMLVPISGLAFIPIASFVTLQFPLMVDLFKSTYLPIFGSNKKRYPIHLRAFETLRQIVKW